MHSARPPGLAVGPSRALLGLVTRPFRPAGPRAVGLVLGPGIGPIGPNRALRDQCLGTYRAIGP